MSEEYDIVDEGTATAFWEALDRCPIVDFAESIDRLLGLEAEDWNEKIIILLDLSFAEADELNESLIYLLRYNYFLASNIRKSAEKGIVWIYENSHSLGWLSSYLQQHLLPFDMNVWTLISAWEIDYKLKFMTERPSINDLYIPSMFQKLKTVLKEVVNCVNDYNEIEKPSFAFLDQIDFEPLAETLNPIIDGKVFEKGALDSDGLIRILKCDMSYKGVIGKINLPVYAFIMAKTIRQNFFANDSHARTWYDNIINYLNLKDTMRKREKETEPGGDRESTALRRFRESIEQAIRDIGSIYEK